jgi:S1-C subfamily serine protease
MFKHRLVPILISASFHFLFFQSASHGVVESSGDCIVIEFSAEGCTRCGEMHRTTDQAIQDGWVVRRFDTKRDAHMASRWQIQSVPTTILVRNGRELDRILGPIEYREMKQRMSTASSVDSMRSTTTERRSSQENVRTPIVRAQSQLAMVPMSAAATSSAAVSSSAGIAPFVPNAAFSQPLRSKDPRESTVRIRIQEPQQESVGTGTIIDSHHGQALVLTCGHLFRESQGKAKITVETFLGGQITSYPAILVDFQAKDMDIGLVQFSPNTEVPVATLIPKNRKLAEGQTVFSWGCDRGALPSRYDSKITKLNRYLGAPNVEVAGQPVEGRSGGGLFDESGELIGDPELQEGLYNGAEVVYYQLAKLGLQRLFNERSGEQPNTNYLARDIAPNRTAPSTSELTVLLMGSDGKQEQLHITQPNPQLLQALRDSSRRQ